MPPGSAGVPGTLRVALVDSGVNYTLAAIHPRLARDAQGRLIGFDFWDMDRLPFDAHPQRDGQIQRHGTRTASVLLAETRDVSLVPYRYPRPDMRRMRALIDHAASHDVRIMGLPLGGNRADDWHAFESAARAHPEMLFIASAGNNGRDIDRHPVYPAALELPNLLVVTSADDFARPAVGSNTGRRSVDYLVPAESMPVLEFDGSSGLASGSSYAVPRVMALAARLLQHHPDGDASWLIEEIRRRHADGRFPAQVAHGYIADPRRDDRQPVRVASQRLLGWPNTSPTTSDSSSPVSDAGASPDTEDGIKPILTLPVDVVIVEPRWSDREVETIARQAFGMLRQCAFQFEPVMVQRVVAPDYLHDLETGAAQTLMQTVRASGPRRRLTVMFARDSRMQTRFESEAFGRANTRFRPWLQDSVWLTREISDASIALAHELFHVLVNRGDHSPDPGNLMAARTSGNNTALSDAQCERARANVLANRLGKKL